MSNTVAEKRPKRLSELVSKETASGRTFNLDTSKESVDEAHDSGIVVMNDALRLEKEKQIEMEKFLNEPVKILIAKSHEKGFAPKTTDYIAINGVPADILTPKGWTKAYGGYLPRGVPIIVRRKYVEVIAGANIESFTTEIVVGENKEPITKVESSRSYTLPFQLLEDPNREKGPEWFEKLVNKQNEA